MNKRAFIEVAFPVGKAHVTFMPKRAAEFFAGIGLMRMGLDAEGWTTVWANDLDEKKWEMYRANFNDGACEFVLDDGRKFEGKDIPDIELLTNFAG